jgi:DNA-binding transcriptional regulator GbsR (MarR family)
MSTAPLPPNEASAPFPSEPLEQEIIAFWVRVAALFGYPRSMGEIFGAIFISEEPLSADDLAQKLNLSRSGVGQGLKTLQDIGAIRTAHQLTSRKEFFRMQTDLGVLVKQILNARVFPTLEEINRERTALAEQAARQGAPHLVQRFEKLQRWEQKAEPVVKLLRTLI